MPYRERMTTWRRALEDAQDLVAQPAERDARHVAVLSLAWERLASTLEEAAGSGAPGEDHDELVTAMRVALEALRERLSIAEAAPPPRTIVVVANPAPATKRKPPSALDRALDTPMGLHFTVVKCCLYTTPVERPLRLLRKAYAERANARSSQLTREEMEGALAIVGPSVRDARRYFEAAKALPTDRDTAAALAAGWAELTRDLEEAEVVVAFAQSRVRERRIVIRPPGPPTQRPPKDPLARALATPQGVLLAAVHFALRASAVEAARAELRIHARGHHASSREALTKILREVEPAFGEARRLLDRHAPANDPDTDALLANAWRDIRAEIEAAEEEIASVRAFLSGHG